MFVCPSDERLFRFQARTTDTTLLVAVLVKGSSLDQVLVRRRAADAARKAPHRRFHRFDREVHLSTFRVPENVSQRAREKAEITAVIVAPHPLKPWLEV